MAKRRISEDELTIRLRLTQELAERDQRIVALTDKIVRMDAAYGDAIRLADEVMTLGDTLAASIEANDPTLLQMHKITCLRLSQLARGVFGKLVLVSR